MSAQKNTILNFFQRTPKSSSSPNSLPRSTPKANGKNKEPSTPTSSKQKATPKSIVRTKKRIIHSDDDNEENGISSNENQSPNVANRKKLKISLSDLDSDDDDVADPCFNPEKTKEPSSAESESSGEEETEEETPDEDEASPPKKSKSAKVIKNLSTSKLNTSDLNISFNTKKKLSSFAAETDETSGIVENNFSHLKYQFLDAKFIKDKSGRRPDNPDYDSRTLFVPESFLASQTPGQRQWWELKAEHFDKVLFFKMGKFYELFHMDAVLGVEHLDIAYMKGEVAHCGFPEIAFSRFAEILIEKNYTVVRIEQTETPNMMEKRCKTSTKKVTKFDKVVNREVCQVSSKGTRMLEVTDSDYEYLLAIIVKGDRVGIAFVDTTVGTFRIGQYTEDSADEITRTRLNLCHLSPVELLLDEGVKEDSKPLLNLLQSKFPRLKTTILKSHKEFFSPSNLVAEILKNNYYSDYSVWPEVLKERTELAESDIPVPKQEYDLSLRALGGILWYLKSSLIDHALMAQGKIEVFESINDSNKGSEGGMRSMVLDDSSIYDLDILSRTKKEKSLFGILDKTRTPFGRRLLKKWLIGPLFRPSHIRERQEAIKELGGDLSESPLTKDAIKNLKKVLKTLPDFERLNGIVSTNGISLPQSHPENRAIYFDGGLYSKKKIRDFVSALKGFKSALLGCSEFLIEAPISSVLNNLFQNRFPKEELEKILEFFEEAFDWDEAASSGKVLPAPGVDSEYDDILEERKSIQTDSSQILKQVKEEYGDVKFFGSGKNAFQLEIPERFAGKMSSRFSYSSQRKGFKRYVTDETKVLVARKIKNEENEVKVLSSVGTRLFRKFSEHSKVWKDCVHVLSVLDALMALAEYSYVSIDGVFPMIIEGELSLKYSDGFHPILQVIGDGDFIPNDVNMNKSLFILTGANMGGKSTLMRQSALLVVLAQLGVRVPCSSMSLSPVDRIFTRIGASDNIFGGESTFMVELSETSKIIRNMTSSSLVLIDELGRGTTTLDGRSIASSVVEHLKGKGRVLFSTHFHGLTSEFEKDSLIRVHHMAYEEGDKDITFLYKLAPGACPKSHGFNTARLAGLDEGVIEAGKRFASHYESKDKLKSEFIDLLDKISSIKCSG